MCTEQLKHFIKVKKIIIFVSFQVERKQPVSFSILKRSQTLEKHSDCLVPTSIMYQTLLEAGFDDYTEKNCIYYHLQNILPNCTILNLKGYNSSQKKGFMLKFCLHLLTVIFLIENSKLYFMHEQVEKFSFKDI